MDNLKKSPLCRDSNILVYRPPLEFFLDKIETDEYFSFTRQLHGLWDAVIGAWILNPDLRRLDLQNEEHLEDLASSMSTVKKIIEDLHYHPSFYKELFKILKNLDTCDSNFLFGVSDNYFHPEPSSAYSTESFSIPDKCLFKMLPTKDHLNYFKVRFGDRQKVINHFLPEQYSLFDGMLWKQYTYRNEIWKLFDCIKEHPVILVGPAHYKLFGKKVGLTDFHHMEIHGSRASETRDELLERIRSKHLSMAEKSKTPIYFFVAGSVSVYWVYHLHRMLDRKFLIDIGQAFNFLFNSKTALMHREFGFSEKPEKGRRNYDAKKNHGERKFHSSMMIDNGEVSFELSLKFKDIWLEMLIEKISKHLINLYTVKRRYYEFKHHLFRKLNIS